MKKMKTYGVPDNSINSRFYEDTELKVPCNGIYDEEIHGALYYYKDGYLHREDGPAIEYKDNGNSWILNGKEVWNDFCDPECEIPKEDIPEAMRKSIIHYKLLK